nr:transposase, MuDR, MULE transposase domain protein [Tanacetum cinerariifolium]
MNRGFILHENLTYAMLHEMVMKKFKLEAIYPLNLSVKVSSIDDNFDIPDDYEVRFFIECAYEDELAHLTSDFHNNESKHQNESHFEKPECSFAFGDYHEYEDEKNKFDDVVDDKPLPNYQKWQKYMSFKPDIPETPLYKSKLMISKYYKKETNVKVGKIFVNKEALDLAIRLKALDEGYQFLNDRSAPERDKTKALFWRICKAYITEEFSRSMSHLQDIQIDAYDKLCQEAASVKLAETYRAMVREWYYQRRKLTAASVKLAETYRAMVREWYYQRRKLT